MNKKSFYVTPNIKDVEFTSEGILCSSECQGGIDQLEEKYDWSDMWNN